MPTVFGGAGSGVRTAGERNVVSSTRLAVGSPHHGDLDPHTVETGDLVEHGLDLSPFYDDYVEVRGAPPYDPRLMLKLLIYGYSNGSTSSRELERRCHHDVAFMFLTAQAAPDFVVISRFRRRHLQAFEALFTQVLTLCAQAGLVSLGGLRWTAARSGRRRAGIAR